LQRPVYFKENPMSDQNTPYETKVEAGKEYWYCACGRSKTQPFCDGSHQGSGVEPIPFTAKETGTVWLCGCRMSDNLPFCDGTHNSL
jgi:CDGSH-type Zn-finger protein